MLAFGNAASYGSAESLHLARPIVGKAATPTRQGYWLVAADAGVSTYGDAPFSGFMGGKPLKKAVVEITVG